MKKGVLIGIIVLTLVLLPLVLADAEDEIQRLTHYAEEYEAGNIDYVKLMVYSGSVRENLNEELGAVGREHGGMIKQEQIRKMLGEPTEETKWVWVPKAEHERKVLNPVPAWRKIIFDGRKIQIRLEAFPMIFVKGKDFESNFGYEEETIVYNLHFDISFKRPEDQIDIQSKIGEVKRLAEIFNGDPAKQNGENLAKESVNTERAFENSYREGGGECVGLMNSIFGSEFKRETQKLLVQEISFYDGDNFEAVLRLEMCDDCEWNWVNLDLRIEGRGPGFHMPRDARDPDEKESRKRFEGMDDAGFKAEIKELLGEIRRFLEEGNIGPAMAYKNRLWMLNEAWNQKSNDLWDEVKSEVDFNPEEGVDDPYFWIKEDQRQRQKVAELRRKKFEDKKRFYAELFSGYDRREYYFEQQEWEKRLIEVFKERGEEVCDNNQDDNENEQVDCEDEQCLGKICGRMRLSEEECGSQCQESCKEKLIDPCVEECILEGEEKNCNGICHKDVVLGECVSECSQECSGKTKELYCIAGSCQQKEEIVKPKGPVCGNHVCEEKEGECLPSAIVCDENDLECSVTADCGPVYCPEDCTKCPEHEPIECSEGERVVFSGNDENGCPLKPICIEDKSCFSDDDCEFRCGVGECVFEDEAVETGKCELVELTECKPVECNDGEKIIEKCENGDEILTGICIDGIWMMTLITCPEGPKEEVCCEIKHTVGDEEPRYELKSNTECPPKEQPFSLSYKVVDKSYCEGKKLECVQCGDGCISKEQSMVADCERPSKEFDCAVRDDECVVVNLKESLECSRCGEGCIPREELESAFCEESPKDFDCIEENGRCVVLEKEREYECIDNSLYFGEELIQKCGEEEVCDSDKKTCLILERNPIVENHCITKADCGNENDVCSNGECVLIPEVVEDEEEEIDLSNIEIDEEVRKEWEERDEEESEGMGGEMGEGNFRERREEGEGFTGNIVDRLFNGVLGLVQPGTTGFAVDEGRDEGDDGECPDAPSPPSEVGENCKINEIYDENNCLSGHDVVCDGGGDCPDVPEPDYDRENCWIEEKYDESGCLVGYSVPVCDDSGGDDGEWGEDDGEWNEGDWEDRDEEEGGMHEEEQRQRCEDECRRPCVEKCIRESCGEELNCNIDEESKKCEGGCEADEGCVGKCMEGGDWWQEFEEEDEHKEERGVFAVWGSCRKSQGKTESHIHFGGWGEPFEDVERYKHKYYEREGDWCKWDLENSIKQRREIEKGFNQEFAVWFFEDYLANSENMMGAASGLFEMYWRVVDNSRMTAERMQCLGKNDISEIYEPKLISFEYKTDYGSVEYWEELKEVSMPWMGGEKVRIVSPYMKVWIFPTKRFIKYEFRESMKKGEMPGPPEDKIEMKNEGFPSEEDLEFMRDEDYFMEQVEEIADKQGGNARSVLQVVDFETNEIVFNMLIEINREDIIKITPMLPEDVGEYDTKVEIDFEKMYDLIMYEEKNMMGAHTESPPWDRRKVEPIKRVNEFVKGVRMYFKAKAMVNSARITPEENADNAKDFMIEMMKMMGEGEKEKHMEGPPEGFEDLSGEEKEELMKEFGGGIFDRGEEGGGGFDMDDFQEEPREEKGGGLFGFFKGGEDEGREGPGDFRDEGGGMEDIMSPEEFKKFKSLPEEERRKIVKGMQNEIGGKY